MEDVAHVASDAIKLWHTANKMDNRVVHRIYPASGQPSMEGAAIVKSGCDN